MNNAGKDFSGKTKISFYMKGTATGKSISINLYPADKSQPGLSVQKNGDAYYVYNLGDVSSDVTIQAATANAKGQIWNSYSGSINATDWVKVTLDISGKALAKSGNLFAFKVGKGVAWNLYLDDFTIE